MPRSVTQRGIWDTELHPGVPLMMPKGHMHAFERAPSRRAFPRVVRWAERAPGDTGINDKVTFLHPRGSAAVFTLCYRYPR